MGGNTGVLERQLPRLTVFWGWPDAYFVAANQKISATVRYTVHRHDSSSDEEISNRGSNYQKSSKSGPNDIRNDIRGVRYTLRNVGLYNLDEQAKSSSGQYCQPNDFVTRPGPEEIGANDESKGDKT